MKSFKPQSNVLCSQVWKQKSWGVMAPQTRFVYVCTRPNLSATHYTTAQGNHQEGEPAMPGIVQTAPSETLAAWEEAHVAGLETWGTLTRETGKGRDPADGLLAFCLSDGLIQGTGVLKYSLSDAIPRDQVTTFVLCWRYGRLSNTSPCTALPTFLTQVIFPSLLFPVIAWSTPPNKVLAPKLLIHALPPREPRLRQGPID